MLRYRSHTTHLNHLRCPIQCSLVSSLQNCLLNYKTLSLAIKNSTQAIIPRFLQSLALLVARNLYSVSMDLPVVDFSSKENHMTHTGFWALPLSLSQMFSSLTHIEVHNLFHFFLLTNNILWHGLPHCIYPFIMSYKSGLF